MDTIENYLQSRWSPWKIPVTVLVFAKIVRKKPAIILTYNYEHVADVLQINTNVL